MCKKDIKKNLTVRLSDTEKKILEDLAIEKDMSKAEYVRYLILKAKEESQLISVVYNSEKGYKIKEKSDELNSIEESFNKYNVKNDLLSEYEIFSFIGEECEYCYKVPLEKLRDIYKIQQALIK